MTKEEAINKTGIPEKNLITVAIIFSEVKISQYLTENEGSEFMKSLSNAYRIMREEIMNLRHFDVNINTFCEVLNINKRYKRNKLQHRYKDINEKIKSLSKNKIILFP